jgi:hypothetical protein
VVLICLDSTDGVHVMLQGSDVINNRLSAYTGDSPYKYLYVRPMLLKVHAYLFMHAYIFSQLTVGLVDVSVPKPLRHPYHQPIQVRGFTNMMPLNEVFM